MTQSNNKPAPITDGLRVRQIVVDYDDPRLETGRGRYEERRSGRWLVRYVLLEYEAGTIANAKFEMMNRHLQNPNPEISETVFDTLRNEWCVGFYGETESRHCESSICCVYLVRDPRGSVGHRRSGWRNIVDKWPPRCLFIAVVSEELIT